MPEILNVRTIHDGWGRYLVATLKLADGSIITREIEDHGDAAAVLPYDRHRRIAVLVRQPRTPLLTRGETVELFEAPAGRLDEAEPEACARRECLEETGYRLGDITRVAAIWSMPGISTERMHLYLAPVEASDRVADGGGLADEHENIAVEDVQLSRLKAMVEAGELTDSKTLCLVQTLMLREPQLFD